MPKSLREFLYDNETTLSEQISVLHLLIDHNYMADGDDCSLIKEGKATILRSVIGALEKFDEGINVKLEEGKAK